MGFKIILQLQRKTNWKYYQIPRVYFLEEDPHVPDTQSLGLHIENYYEKQRSSDEENLTPHKEDFIPDSQTLGTHIESPDKTGEQGIDENIPDEIVHENEADVPRTQTLGTHFESASQTEAANEHDNAYRP